MSGETVQNYKISFTFDKSVDKLKNLQSKMKSFNKTQEASLKRQIALKKQLSKIRTSSTGMDVGPGIPSAPTSRLKASQTAFADLLKKEEKLAAIEARRVRSLEQAKSSFRRSAFWLDEAKDDAERLAKETLRVRINSAKTANEVRNIVAAEKSRLRMSKRNTAELKKQSFLLRRMSSSSKQVAGNMIGAFAVVAGLGAVVNIGQEFQSIENVMLAVSGSSELAGENFKFVKEEAFRLGASLKSTAKDYAKLLASAKGQITTGQSEELLTGILEASTVLGLSADDTTGAVRALQQMLGKTKVTAEELRLQLAERLPGAVGLMAKAAQQAGLIGKEVPEGQLVAEMEKLMVQGKLLAKDVLPFFSKELSKFAAPGISKALKSNRVAMNRLIFSLQEAANQMFKGGFGKGLTDFFNSSAAFIRDTIPLWETVGKVIGEVLELMAAMITLFKPTASAIGNILKDLTIMVDTLDAFFAVSEDKGKKTLTFFDRLKQSVELVMQPLQVLLGIMEEVTGFITGSNEGKTGILFNRETEEARATRLGLATPNQTATTPNVTVQSQAPSVTTNVILDGEKIAESVSMSTTVSNLLDSKMHHNLSAL